MLDEIEEEELPVPVVAPEAAPGRLVAARRSADSFMMKPQRGMLEVAVERRCTREGAVVL